VTSLLWSWFWRRAAYANETKARAMDDDGGAGGEKQSQASEHHLVAEFSRIIVNGSLAQVMTCDL